ncbi:hypothetical protein WJX74_002857 [Apatococcus lobatus]|uniref:RNA polymerase II C-terminal domain phosphatase-like n=1 Tax=Apatococcus lobatus TaxID=904363 RepID=A0AAW1QUU6_9CHLO
MSEDASDDLEFLLSAELERESPADVPVAEAPTSTARFRASSKKRAREQESTVPENTTKQAPAGPSQPPSVRPPSAGTCPPHPGTVQGMCIRCGASIGDTSAGASPNVALRYLHAGLELSKTEADRLRSESLKRVLAGNRLILVLDLDHTLLTSTRNNEILDEKLHQKLSKMLTAQSLLPEAERMELWTKLRPGVREFLERMHLCYELHIYTHGTRPYALEMSRVLDPQRRLFAERIVSACDSSDKEHKNLDVLLGVETAVLIVDNTDTVWPKHSSNLLHCTSFVFFPADVPRLASSALLAACDPAHDTPDPMLPAAADILEDVHRMYFAGADAVRMDAKQCLAAARGKILAGVHIVFSRVFPQLMTHPETHSLWKLATQLGATCGLATDAATTHVVANSRGTDKVVWALKHGKHVVTPSWLSASKGAWHRAPEKGHPVTAQVPLPQRPSAGMS